MTTSLADFNESYNDFSYKVNKLIIKEVIHHTLINNNGNQARTELPSSHPFSLVKIF